MTLEPQERTERKFSFRPADADSLQSWLEHSCLPDPDYPHGSVSTIYFDTPRLDLYAEKTEGDFLKCKVRLRWYDGPSPTAPAVRCYLEVKHREGAMTGKTRTELDLPGASLIDPLHDERIAGLPFLAPGSADAAGELVPMVLLCYERRRFFEPQSGTRISLDTDILCLAANRDFLVAFPPVGLETGVLELKGRPGRGEWVLEPIRGLLRPVSFSKYAAAVRRVLDPSGRDSEP